MGDNDLQYSIGMRTDPSVDRAAAKADSTIRRLNRTLAGVAKTGQLVADKTSAGIKKIDKAAEQARKEFEELRKTMERVYFAGLHLSLIGGVITGLSAFPVASAAEFEAEMSKVLAVTAGAADQFAELNAVASELGRTTKFTATEAAQGLTFLGMAGFNAAEAISALPDTLNLAIAGGIELGRSADIVTNVVKAMGLSINDLGMATDILANTITSSNVNMEQLAESLKYVAAPAAALGIDLAEVTATIGALGDAGIQGSLSAVNLRTILISLASPSKKAQDAMKRLGVTIQYTDEGMVDVLATMEALRDANFSLADATAIFQRRAAASALIISKSVDRIRELADANRNASGAADQMARIMEDNVHGALIRLKSAFDGLMRAIASGVMGPFKALVTVLTGVVSAFASALDAIGPFAGILLSIVATLGVLITSLGLVALAVGTYGRAITTLTILLEGNSSAVIGTKKAYDALVIAMTRVRAFGMTSALEAMVAGFAKLKTVILGTVGAMGRLVVAHPLLAAFGLLITTAGALVLKMRKLFQTLRQGTVETRGYAESIHGLSVSAENLAAKFSRVTENSKAQEAAVKKATAELTVLAKRNDAVGEAASKTLKILRDQNSTLSEQREAVRGLADELNNISLAAIQKHTQAAQEEIDLLLNKYQLLGGRIERGFGSLYHSITTFYGNLFTSFFTGKEFNAYEASFDAFDKKIKDKAEQLRKKMEGELAKTISARIADMVKIGSIDLAGGVKELMVILKNMGVTNENVIKSIIDNYRQLQETMRDSTRAIGDTADKDIESAQLRRMALYDQEIDRVSELSATIAEMRRQSMDDPATITFIKKKGEAMVAYGNSFKTAAAQAKILITEEQKLYNEAANQRVQSIKLAVALGLRAQREGQLLELAIAKDTADKTAEYARQRVADMRKVLVTDAPTHVKEAFDKVEAAANQLTDSATEAGAKFGEAYLEALKGKLTDAKSAFQDYMSIVESLHAKIQGIEQTTADQIKNIRRKSMSEAEKQADMAREAQEKLTAAKKEYSQLLVADVPKLKAMNQYLEPAEAIKATKEFQKRLEEVVKQAESAKDIMASIALGTDDKSAQEDIIRQIQEIEDFQKSVYEKGKDLSLFGAEATKQSVDDIMQAITDFIADPKEVRLDLVLSNAMEVQRAIDQITTETDNKVSLVLDTKTLDKELAAIEKKIDGMDLKISVPDETITVIKNVDTGITTITNQLSTPHTLTINSKNDQVLEIIDTINDEFENGVKIVTLIVREKREVVESVPENSVARALGGPIPGGYGGGDKIPLWAEPGEWVIRKEAVRALGGSFMAMINSVGSSLSGLSSRATNRIVGASQAVRRKTGGVIPTPASFPVAHLGQLDLRIGTQTFPIMASRSVADELKVLIKREAMTRSN